MKFGKAQVSMKELHENTRKHTCGFHNLQRLGFYERTSNERFSRSSSKKKQLSQPLLLAKELELNRKLFPDHLPSILHGALVGALVHRGQSERLRLFDTPD